MPYQGCLFLNFCLFIKSQPNTVLPFIQLSKVFTCILATSALVSSFFFLFLLSVSLLSCSGSWFSLFPFLLSLCFRFQLQFWALCFWLVICFSLPFYFLTNSESDIFSAAWGFHLLSFIMPSFSSISAVSSHLNFYM